MTKSAKIILSAAVLGLFVASALVSAQGMPGEKKVGECCLLKHELKGLPGDKSTTIQGPDSKCQFTGTGDPASPLVIKAGNTIGQSAGTCYIEKAQGDDPDCLSKVNWGAYCAIDTVYTVTDWIFWIAFVIAAVIIIIGGIMFMTATGDPEKAKKARQVLVYGIIGILIAVLAKLIPAFARFFVGA